MTGLARAAAAVLAAALLAGLAPAAAGAAAPAPAAAVPAWRAEFDDVCAKTQDAMGLPTEELRQLVARADRLRLEVERLEPTQRKVYLRRLEACRNLYQFVLESRERS
jgi:hypothetical protein